MQCAAGQIPQQPGVNGAEGQFAARGPLSGARHVIQQPPQLAAGKIRVNHQAGLVGDDFPVTGPLQLIAEPGRAPILPDNGIIDGSAGLPVPNNRGLASQP